MRSFHSTLLLRSPPPHVREPFVTRMAAAAAAAAAAASLSTRKRKRPTMRSSQKLQQSSGPVSSGGADSGAVFFDRTQSFAALPLEKRLFKAIARCGLVHPTHVQSKLLPYALEGRDCLAKAKTGAGKTVAYLIPVIQNMLTTSETEQKDIENKNMAMVRTVILVPTKELVQQVFNQLKLLLHYASDLITAAPLIATTNINLQLPLLRENPAIILSTPATLLEHVRASNVSLDIMQMLVIDEADLLLSFGYANDVRELLGYMPKYYQSILTSATLTEEVDELQQLVLNDPAIIKIDEQIQANLSQLYLEIAPEDKFLVVYSLLKLGFARGKVLFFVNSVDAAYRLKLMFEQFIITSAVVNAELPFNSRQHILQQFNRGVFDYLIATDESIGKELNDDEFEASFELSNVDSNVTGNMSIDAKNDKQSTINNGELGLSVVEKVIVGEHSISVSVEDNSNDGTRSSVIRPPKSKGLKNSSAVEEFGVSRGIDFRNVAVVINYDFPTSVKSYVHRVGRTARAGRSGLALSLCSYDERPLLDRVLDYQRQKLSAAAINADVPLRAFDFNMADIEGFRYRVEDVCRAVTRLAVREARLKEIKQELLNSEKLRAHFEDNPRELNLLHDRNTRVKPVQRHLKDVPSYLIPNHLKAHNITGRSSKSTSRNKRVKRGTTNKNGSTYSKKLNKRRSDPLRSFKRSGNRSES